LEEITPETVKKLLEKAKLVETKFILVLDEWARQGNDMYRDEQQFKVIYGSVDDVIINEWDSGYPYEYGRTHLLIPKTIPAVIRVERYCDTTSPVIDEELLFMFTSEGWKEVKIR